jgi:phosphoglycerate kinase
VGGGDTIAAVSKFSFDPEKVFLSTGGGAMLEFLANGTLPGIEPLKV